MHLQMLNSYGNTLKQGIVILYKQTKGENMLMNSEQVNLLISVRRKLRHKVVEEIGSDLKAHYVREICHINNALDENQNDLVTDLFKRKAHIEKKLKQALLMDGNDQSIWTKNFNNELALLDTEIKKAS